MLDSKATSVSIADVVVVNAYASVPGMGANHALPHVIDAMTIAARSTFDVEKFRLRLESRAAHLLGFDFAIAVAGARAGLAVAADLSRQRRPGANIAAIHPAPHTKYTKFLTIDGILSPIQVDLKSVPFNTALDSIALCLVTLKTGNNDLDWIVETRDILADHSIPLIVNAALAPWHELSCLADSNSVVVTSASKYHAGPTSAGFLLIGNEWASAAQSLTEVTKTEILRPGKEALAGLSALIDCNSVDLRADSAAEEPDRLTRALLDREFICSERDPFWLGTASSMGYYYTRSFTAGEGGVETAEKIATRLWNFNPPVIVGCSANKICVNLAGLSPLERDYLAAAISITVDWALNEGRE